MLPELRKVLELRLQYAQAATSKYSAIHNRHVLGRLYDTLQAWGAGRTGRWAGRGLQLQNLKRPTMDSPEEAADLLASAPDLFAMLYELEDLGSIIRASLKAPDGKVFVVRDLFSIEPRVLGAMTGDPKLNAIFEAGLDPYKSFAVDWLGIPYDQVDKATRSLCKPPFLGCGYGLWKDGLVAYAESMGVDMDEETALSAASGFRKTYSHVPRFWKQTEACFKAAVTQPGIHGSNLGLPMQREGRMVTIRLPSGRKLYYDWPEWDEGTGLSYMGQNQYTGKWERIRTYGAKVTENEDQAIACDILYGGMKRYWRRGGTLVGHIHDELIALEDEDKAEEWGRIMEECLTESMPGAPRLLLGAAGYQAGRYRKD